MPRHRWAIRIDPPRQQSRWALADNGAIITRDTREQARPYGRLLAANLIGKVEPRKVWRHEDGKLYQYPPKERR